MTKGHQRNQSMEPSPEGVASEQVMEGVESEQEVEGCGQTKPVQDEAIVEETEVSSAPISQDGTLEGSAEGVASEQVMEAVESEERRGEGCGQREPTASERQGKASANVAWSMPTLSEGAKAWGLFADATYAAGMPASMR